MNAQGTTGPPTDAVVGEDVGENVGEAVGLAVAGTCFERDKF